MTFSLERRMRNMHDIPFALSTESKMKTHLTILAALVVATPLTAQTSFGVRGGMTLSTFAVSEEDDEVEVIYQPGFHFGVTAALGSGGPGVVLSAAYSQRGTEFRV